MADFIKGTNFIYQIDTSYNDNRDGFIAEGTESIVFKGIKVSGNLVYPCALKFKPRSRLNDFMHREYKILKALQTCRSIVRILDVIEDIGDFTIPIPFRNGRYIQNRDYFCVVEEYIDGYSLQDFCIEQWFEYDRKEHRWKRNNREYTYREIVKYQNQLIQFMYNFCEIMKFISKRHDDLEISGVLHCDIKPENIMVTKNGNELVLIDFGRSQQINDNNGYQHISHWETQSFLADYNKRNWEIERGHKNNIYTYGTVGYAAPECYAGQNPDVHGSKTFPFREQESCLQHGFISIESDIFGFGATFWECFAIYNIGMYLLDHPPVRTEEKTDVPKISDQTFFREAISELYENQIYSTQHLQYYCDRDFRGLNSAYHEEIEKVILRCTRQRMAGYRQQNDSDSYYYHNYEKLQEDIEKAKNVIPAIDRKSDPFVGEMVGIAGFLSALSIVFGVMLLITGILSGYIAEDKWNRLTSTYTVGQINSLENIANEMMATAIGGKKYENFEKILQFTYGGTPNDNVIDKEEASILIGLIKTYFSGDERIASYIDEMMKRPFDKDLNSICNEIVISLTLPEGVQSDGYQLAKTLRNVVNANDSDADVLSDAYDMLLQHENDISYKTVISEIAAKLMRGKKTDTIARAKNTDRQSISQVLTKLSS